MRMSFVSLVVVASVLVGMSPANGATLIDQQNSVATGVIGGASTEGQTFTAGLADIDFATFYTFGTSSNTSVLVKLYAGTGYQGTLLGTTNSVVVGTNNGYSADSIPGVEFDFGQTIALTIGSTYTLQLVGYNLNNAYNNQDPYAGGTMLANNGSTFTGADLKFAEGIFQSDVPEPATWAMMLLGFGGIGLAVRRRKSVPASIKAHAS